jgi:hypothetical protein
LRVYSHALEERDRAAAAVIGGILHPNLLEKTESSSKSASSVERAE